MKSIKLKLWFGYAAIVLFSVSIVSAPFLFNETRGLERNIRKEAALNMNIEHDSVTALFEKPQAVVKTLALYCKQDVLDLKTAQDDFAELIKNDKTISAAYFCEARKVNEGGLFYYSGGWIPSGDYDQYQRSWFTDAQKASGIVVTEPYLDVPTKSLVASVVLATHDDSGAFTGVCGLDISLKTLSDAIGSLKLSESGKSFILDRNGLYLTNDYMGKIQTANFFDEYPAFAKFKGKIGSDVFFEPRVGGKYIAAQVIDEKSGWILATVGNSGEIYQHFEREILFVVLMGAASLGISLFAAFFLSSKIVTPIKSVVGAVDSIAAGNADLTKRLTVSGNDEISNLGNGFNRFMEKMQGIIGDVKSSKNELARAGEDLSSATSDTANSIGAILQSIKGMHEKIDNQKESVLQVYAAVNQIARTFDSFEGIVESESSSVSQASAAVEQMIGSISSVNESVEKMTASFSSLRADSHVGISKQKAVNDKITEIEIQSKMLHEANKTISLLASQTNLLAMNASIEAAHAGKAGSGFAVVAEEIRKLSETSSAQSKTIGMQLANIRKSISDAVAASSESNISFESVSKKLEETDALVTQIQSAMEEQNEGSRQITGALHAMNDSAEEVRTSSSEMAQGNRTIFGEMGLLQKAALEMCSSMDEMSANAQKIRETGSALSSVSAHIKFSISKIGEQVDQFRA